MWNMRWKLISLSVALITATSAKFLAIDNLTIQSDNVTLPEDNNYTLSDDDVHDNRSFIKFTTDNTSLSISRDLRLATSADGEDVGQLVISIASSDSRPAASRQYRHASEVLKSNDPSQSFKAETNEIPPSDDHVFIARSQENESIEKHPSSENGSPEKLRTEEDTNEKPISIEPESNEKPGSDEGEKPESGETPDGSTPSSRSRESKENENTEEDPISNGKEEEQVVQTTHGPVKGHKWQESSEIIGFIDIPYGQFDGPFEAPVTAQSWLDSHNITEHNTYCPQFQNDEYINNTDCLTLSIFTPKDANNVSVLFHIYDSHSNIKSADPLIYGPDYLVPRGVILVLPNYRVGPMGFLCLQNETAPGNAALKDLSLALEWVKDNINLFGGNPENIIVSGDGAAGAYAGYLGLCSRSRYYINKVITESGSALSHLALDRDPTGTAYKLADKIRLEHPDGVIFNNTFEEASLETIIKAAKGMRLDPCIELDKEPFMNDTPWKMLQEINIDTTFMIGTASYAGAHEAVDTKADTIAKLNDNFDHFLPEDLTFTNDNERKEFAQKLKEQYFGEGNITLNHIEELSVWYTDASYLGPGIRLARQLLTAGATVFLYEFAFVGKFNRELEALNKPVPGAARSDIVGYLFHKNGTDVVEQSMEEHMIKLLADLWVSFINSGKPVAANIEWNEFKKTEDSEEEWLVINTEAKLKKGIHVERLRLWTTLYKDHFIEKNSALRYNHPPYMFLVAAALMCWMTNNKFNYGRH